MILVTGAGGKTGRAVAEALTDETVRLFLRRDADWQLHSAEVFIGDMTNLADWTTAMQGVEKVYHICPNMHPQEVAIGRMAIDAARAASVQHFVYHSVLHPQTQKMPHHWNKLLVEEMLFESGVPFTILQPTAYMQNIRLDDVFARGVFSVPYAASTPISLVDLREVAEVAAKVLTEGRHAGAIYELVGTEPLRQMQVADILGVALVEIERGKWWISAEKNGLSPYAINTLIAMFEYYESFGLVGSPSVLRALLRREPTSLQQFVEREKARSSTSARS